LNNVSVTITIQGRRAVENISKEWSAGLQIPCQWVQ
jgi:hypothetical protein